MLKITWLSPTILALGYLWLASHLATTEQHGLDEAFTEHSKCNEELQRIGSASGFLAIVLWQHGEAYGLSQDFG